jgi:hypothetical protein
VQLPSGPTDFRTTVVKPYLQPKPESKNKEDKEKPAEQDNTLQDKQPRRNTHRNKRPPARFRQNTVDISIFLQDNLQPPLPLYTDSRRKELNSLLKKGVFKLINIADIPQRVRIFNSRFVNQIKDAGTDKAFKKSRLVVQAYNNQGKELVLTQSPTIQRVSQKLILALATTLQDTTSLYLRDISQAYVQSTTRLNRDFFVRPPQELKLEKGSILKVIKPLYSVPEARNHWFNTYHRHHQDKLHIKESTYNSCLLYTNENSFSVVSLQTNNTLFLADKSFAETEESELHKANFLAKDKKQLTSSTPIKFNSGQIELQNNSILLTQERQCQNLKLVALKAINLTSSKGEVHQAITPKDQYVAQKARGAYIATVCQPEAAFDLSFAAQVVNPKEKNAKQLNKRLQ